MKTNTEKSASEAAGSSTPMTGSALQLIYAKDGVDVVKTESETIIGLANNARVLGLNSPHTDDLVDTIWDNLKSNDGRITLGGSWSIVRKQNASVEARQPSEDD